MEASFADFRHDLQRTRWLQVLRWHSILLWFGALVATTTLVSLRARVFGSSQLACKPNDSFGTADYNYWSSDSFFDITLGMGHLTFSEVKIIDVCWDLVIGRGGQAVLAFVSWLVFKRYITACMTTASVSYRTFYTIFLQKEASILDVWGLLKDFCTRVPLHSKFAMGFMVTTMIFILVFPTMAGAMTGYSRNAVPYITNDSGTESKLTPWSSFQTFQHIIWDGSRIGYSDGEIGHKLDQSLFDYIKSYGLDGKNKTESVFHGTNGPINLPSPSLNITFPDFYRQAEYRSRFLTDLPLSIAFDSYHPNQWVMDDRIYDSEYIQKHGICQPKSDYKWGFSFLQLNIMIYLLILWSTGVLLMWFLAHHSLRAHDREDISGKFKGMFELVDAMEVDVKAEGKNPRCLTEKNLAQMVENSLRGGKIAYAYADSKDLTRFSVIVYGLTRNWLKKEKWWLLGLFAAVAFLGIVMRYFYWDMPWFTEDEPKMGVVILFLSALGLVLGCWFSILIGTTARSRVFIIILLALLFALPVTIPLLLFVHFRRERRMGEVEEITVSNEVLPEYNK